jgi:hypothetical protein
MLPRLRRIGMSVAIGVGRYRLCLHDTVEGSRSGTERMGGTTERVTAAADRKPEFRR